MRIKNILLNVILLIFLFVLIYLYIYINYNLYEKFSSLTKSTLDSNKAETETIHQEAYETESDYQIGLDPSNAFKSVVDIMCQNRVVALRGPSAGTSFGNGYYWINVPSVGPVLLYVLTDETVYNGGWILAMRGAIGTDTFNLTNNFKYNTWLADITTRTSYSQYITTLEIDPSKGYNNQLGLIRYNTDLQGKFQISSIGEKIYITNSIYDVKFESFNKYLVKEILVIFYSKKLESTNQKMMAYYKIPNRDLDSYSTLNKSLSMTPKISLLEFRATNITDLVLNFSITIYDISSNLNSKKQITTINCLFGVYGQGLVRDDKGQETTVRIIQGVGIRDIGDTNIISYSALRITIPQSAKSRQDFSYEPVGFEIYVK